MGTKEISPDILHFATHGFSFNKPSIPSSIKENFYTDNTLLTSGLLFAGGNNFWGTNNISLDKEDGILNAFEISGLDFSNTKLVVMSACQTALGEIKGSEGVFGLQRAFKMAGAEYIIASLWKVPDAETAEMMILFYENLAKNESIEDAFRNAQLLMRKKYPPYYWAGFILTR
jgi:CHAT domain-containing protein